MCPLGPVPLEGDLEHRQQRSEEQSVLIAVSVKLKKLERHRRLSVAEGFRAVEEDRFFLNSGN